MLAKVANANEICVPRRHQIINGVIVRGGSVCTSWFMFIQLWGLLRAKGKIILSVQKQLGFLFSLYLDELKSSLMALSNKHKKLLDCQFKIAKLRAIISTWKKVFSSVYDYSVFNWQIRPNTRSSKPKQMSKESSTSWARGVWFTKVDC